MRLLDLVRFLAGGVAERNVGCLPTDMLVDGKVVEDLFHVLVGSGVMCIFVYGRNLAGDFTLVIKNIGATERKFSGDVETVGVVL